MAVAGVAMLSPIAALADDTDDFLAAFKHYPINIKPDPNFDASPYTFDFSKAQLTNRYDGYSCYFSLTRLDFGDELARGKVAFANGRLAFAGDWTRGGIAKPETFADANVGVTEKGLLVGKMPVFTEFINMGDVPQDAIPAEVKIKKGTLGADVPNGKVVFRVNDWIDASLELYVCQKQ